jgi:hypothetical protein
MASSVERDDINPHGLTRWGFTMSIYVCPGKLFKFRELRYWVLSLRNTPVEHAMARYAEYAQASHTNIQRPQLPDI